LFPPDPAHGRIARHAHSVRHRADRLRAFVTPVPVRDAGWHEGCCCFCSRTAIGARRRRQQRTPPQRHQEYDVPNRNHDHASQDDASRSKGRGFAGMDAQQQRQIASAGGRAAHASGHAHEFTSEEARQAGRKGGEARSQRSRAGAGSDRDIQDEAGGASMRGGQQR
jgi:general stress protein YciG